MSSTTNSVGITSGRTDTPSTGIDSCISIISLGAGSSGNSTNMVTQHRRSPGAVVQVLRLLVDVEQQQLVNTLSQRRLSGGAAQVDTMGSHHVHGHALVHRSTVHQGRASKERVMRSRCVFHPCFRLCCCCAPPCVPHALNQARSTAPKQASMVSWAIVRTMSREFSSITRRRACTHRPHPTAEGSH